MLFSATFKKKIERLARDVLIDPVKIVQGSIGEASEDVHQIVKVMDAGGFKWQWLLGMGLHKISISNKKYLATRKAKVHRNI